MTPQHGLPTPLRYIHCGSMQVLFVGVGLAIIDGLNNDAPIGTTLSFVSSATG